MTAILKKTWISWKNISSIKRSVIIQFGVILFMFGFTFALIPLYTVFCKVTGLNGKIDLNVSITGNSSYEKNGRYRVHSETIGRLVTIEFDANVQPNMPFEFVPEHTILQVTPGTLSHTSYYVKNKTDKTLIVQAIPSISPGIVAKYLKKLECFCFNQQILKPHEEARLPLRFWLEPEFPDSVHRLTLSYTLFDVTNTRKEKNL